jgi:hypothetical protein
LVLQQVMDASKSGVEQADHLVHDMGEAGGDALLMTGQVGVETFNEVSGTNRENRVRFEAYAEGVRDAKEQLRKEMAAEVAALRTRSGTSSSSSKGSSSSSSSSSSSKGSSSS